MSRYKGVDESQKLQIELAELIEDDSISLIEFKNKLGLLLERAAATIPGGETPFLNRVNARLEKSVGPYAMNEMKGFLPVQTAIRAGKLDRAKVLLEAGASIDKEASTKGNALKMAVLEINPEAVRFLINHGANINKHNYYSDPVLISTIVAMGRRDTNATKRAKYLDMVRLLLSLGADPNVETEDSDDPDHEFGNPLQYALRRGNFEVAKLLLEHGANPRQLYSWLVSAIENENMPLLNFILDQGININEEITTSSFNSWTARMVTKVGSPLLYAIISGKKHIVDMLLAKGADQNGRDVNGKPYLLHALESGNKEIIDIFLTKDIDINAKNADGKPYLLHAIQSGKNAIVDLFLTRGADLNAKNAKGKGALQYAIESGNKKIVDMLLARGIVLNTEGVNRTPELIEAIETQNEAMVEILLAIGADPNGQAESGNPLLVYAMDTQNPTIIEMLLAKGADPNGKDSSGNIHLLQAIEMQNKGILEMLLEKGADPNVKGPDGKIPLLYAIEIGYKGAAGVLLANGADVNVQDVNGNSGLIYAIATGDKRLVKLFIEAGANPEIPTNNGTTPLEFVARTKQTELLTYLIKQFPDISISERLAKNIRAGKYSEEITDILMKRLQPSYVKLWTGFSQGDVEHFQTILAAPDIANQYSSCPICLNFVTRADGCMYMSHVCPESARTYHRELYEIYKNPAGLITWCTICSRICIGHRHYTLSDSKNAEPTLVPLANVSGSIYGDDCRPQGGGGQFEKYVRTNALLGEAGKLMKEGPIPQEVAFRRLCEANWNAPLAVRGNANTRARLETQFADKKWNVPLTNFPVSLGAAKANEEEAVRNYPRPAPNRNNAALQPLVEPDEDGDLMITFRHREPDGTLVNHTDDSTKGGPLDLDTFKHGMDIRLREFGTPGAIRCPYYPTCKAYLYPEEVDSIVKQVNDESIFPAAYYDRYKEIFNKRRTVLNTASAANAAGGTSAKGGARSLRGGNSESFFKPATNAMCALPDRKPKGGRRRKTRRRRINKRRQTRHR